METLSFEQMEMIEGGVSRAERNAGCASMGLAAGLASFWNPFSPLIGGLTTLGCMLVTDYNK
jgi:hypothetical protein